MSCFVLCALTLVVWLFPLGLALALGFCCGLQKLAPSGRTPRTAG